MIAFVIIQKGQKTAVLPNILLLIVASLYVQKNTNIEGTLKSKLKLSKINTEYFCCCFVVLNEKQVLGWQGKWQGNDIAVKLHSSQRFIFSGVCL